MIWNMASTFLVEGLYLKANVVQCLCSLQFLIFGITIHLSNIEWKGYFNKAVRDFIDTVDNS